MSLRYTAAATSDQAYLWERVSSETRFQRDPALAIPAEVQAQLSEGFLAPHRNIKRAPGAYYYFGHLGAETSEEKLNPKPRLRTWTREDGLITFEQKWPIGPIADLDRACRRILVSSASDGRNE